MGEVCDVQELAELTRWRESSGRITGRYGVAGGPEDGAREELKGLQRFRVASGKKEHWVRAKSSVVCWVGRGAGSPSLLCKH